MDRSPAKFLIILLVIGASAVSYGQQGSAPVLTGSWVIEFSRRSQHYKVQFVAQQSGEATLVALDPVSNQPISSPPTAATWSFGGQSPQIYVFNISGEVALPSATSAQPGTLELTASAPVSQPVMSLSGWGQFHPGNESGDTRGSEDPSFNFTATRILVLEIVYPSSGGKVHRGQDLTIQWVLQSALPITSQQILLSLDNGSTFETIAASIEGDARSYIWTVPRSLSKSKQALIKITATDSSGNSADAVSSQAFRIK